MKNYKILASLILFGVLLAIIWLSRASIWESRLESFLNSHLNPEGWVIDIGSLDGNLLSTIRAENIHLENEDSVIVDIENIETNLNLINTLMGGVDMDRLIVKGLNVIPGEIKLLETPVRQKISSPKLPPFQFHLRRFELDGSLPLTIKGDQRIYSVQFKGGYKQELGWAEMMIESLSGGSENIPNAFSVNNISTEIDSSRVFIFTDHGKIMGVPFQGEISALFEESPTLSAEIKFGEFEIPSTLFEKLPLKPKFSSLQGSINFNSDFHQFEGEVSVSNALGLDMKGRMTIRNEKDHLAVDQIDLRGETAQLTLQGLYEYSGRMNGTLSLTHLDLSEWITRQQETELSGFILFEGLLEHNRISAIDATLEVHESKIFENELITLSGSVDFQDTFLDITHPLTLTIGPSSVVMDGQADFGAEYLDLDLTLNDADVFLVNNFWTDTLKSGTATGTLQISGPFDIPSVKTDLVCEGIRYKNTRLEYFELNSQINRIWDLSSGYLQMKLGRGTWNEYGFDNGTVDIRFHPEKWELNSMEFAEGENFLQLSGFYAPEDSLHLDRIQVSYRGHYLASPRPLDILLIENGFRLAPFELHIDDGVVKGTFQRGQILEGSLELSNIEASLVQALLGTENFPLSGIAFGKADFIVDSSRVEFHLNGAMKNGTFYEHPYDRLDLGVTFKNRIFYIDNFKLAQDMGTEFTLSGEIPMPETRDQPVDIQMTGILKKVNMDLINELNPAGWPLQGIVTGDVHVTGNTQATGFEFNLQIEETAYDLVPLGLVKGKGYYDNRRLIFEEFSSENHGSIIIGHGYLPLDLNVDSKGFGHYFADDSLYIFSHGDLRTLEFLTAYISQVDSMTGQFDIDLILSGDPQRIIRDGHLVGKDANIYTLLLTDPIDRINCRIDLIENLFQIESFSGRMEEQDSKNENNISLSGAMNLEQFFEPGYDISLVGEDIYVQTLVRDIEGRTDVEITMTGKDTILIAGIVSPLSGVMRKEFTVSDVGKIPDESSRVITHYQIHFPIDEEFLLQNSQVDAVVTGDITISKMGMAASDFSGELVVSEGKFYYYHDVFEDLNGSLVFDGKGFHPTMDISAYTKIGNEQINITLLGPLEKPELFLESSSGFSQSDILELLTFHQRFEDQEISSAGFGAQAQTLLGAYLESQLEKNLFKVSGLGELGLVDDVDVSGVSSLINPESEEEFTISAERKLTQQLSLNYSYKRSFSLVKPNQSKMGVELKLNPYFSLVGSVDEEGFMSVKYRLRYSY